MRFDLADLSLFRHVVEAGSITARRRARATGAGRGLDPHPQHGGGLGAPLLVRGRQGVTPTQAGRTLLQHARTILRAGRTAARGPRRLCRRARRPGPGAVQHQRADRVPAGGAQLVPRRPSACQRRPRGAAERRDRRPDRRGRRRHRHRRRHRRCRRARPPIRSAATVSCWWWRATTRWRDAPKIAFAEVLDYDFVGLDRASALQRFLAGKASRVGRPLRLRVQLRSFDAVCRLVECNVGVGIVPAAIITARRSRQWRSSVDLTDLGRCGDLTICIGNSALPPFARQLVEHMRAGAHSINLARALRRPGRTMCRYISRPLSGRHAKPREPSRVNA